MTQKPQTYAVFEYERFYSVTTMNVGRGVGAVFRGTQEECFSFCKLMCEEGSTVENSLVNSCRTFHHKRVDTRATGT